MADADGRPCKLISQLAAQLGMTGLAGWLAGWLTSLDGWLAGCLAGWPDWLTSWLADWAG